MDRPSPGDSPGPPDPGPQWIKSSLSFSNGNCVEVASLSDGQVGVRDSKHSDGPVLRFTPGEWRAFADRARNAEFDPTRRFPFDL